MTTHRYREIDVTRVEYTNKSGQIVIRWDSPVFQGLRTKTHAHRAIDEFHERESQIAHHDFKTFWRLVAENGQIVRQFITREEWSTIMQGVRP